MRRFDHLSYSSFSKLLQSFVKGSKRKRTNLEDDSENWRVAKKRTEPAGTETELSPLPIQHSPNPGPGWAASTVSTEPTEPQDLLKCRNFLASLLRLASKQPGARAEKVRELVQGLIENKMELEVFTAAVLKELNWRPSLGLPSFLKKSLPALRRSLASRELTLEGVTAPREGSGKQLLSANIRSIIFDYSSDEDSG